MGRNNSGGGCFKIFAIGCGCLTLLLVIAAIVATMSFGRFMSAFENVKGTFGDLMSVQASISAEYGAEHVQVTIKRETSVEGSILEVELVNPEFLQQSEVDVEAKALEIATFTKSVLPSPDEWAVIEITVAQRSESGFSFASQSHFTFPVGELPGLEGETDPEPGSLEMGDEEDLGEVA